MENFIRVITILFFLISVLFLSSFDSVIDEERKEIVIEYEERLRQYEIKIDSLEARAAAEKIRWDPETIWLARGIYSETNDPSEMLFVGQVIQNRVHLKYNGKTSYKDVILDPFQFSAFNRDNPNRWRYLRLTITDNDPLWQTALVVAWRVRLMEPLLFPATHFYSPVSMVPKYRRPSWATVLQPVPVSSIRQERFLFFTYLD